MKHPIETIVVVTYRRYPGKNQLSRAARLALIVIFVVVLPKETPIALIQRNSSWYLKPLAVLARENDVKGCGVIRVIPQRFEHACIAAKAVFTRVECILKK